jgi:hypothetical protein
MNGNHPGKSAQFWTGVDTSLTARRPPGLRAVGERVVPLSAPAVFAFAAGVEPPW